MSCEDMQQEELEVLASIYDGDPNYKQMTPTCLQYKIGIEEESRSFLLQISWVENYPNVTPEISLNAFYNKDLLPEVKNTIVNKLLEEARNQIGTPMTYTLLEWAKDHAEELTEKQPEVLFVAENSPPSDEKEIKETLTSTKKEKKPQLSKQQKRRLADKVDNKGERPRGWDWVDVVKHLSQGPKANNETVT